MFMWACEVSYLVMLLLGLSLAADQGQLEYLCTDTTLSQCFLEPTLIQQHNLQYMFTCCHLVGLRSETVSP